jgi:hypothetical protein
MKLESHPKLKAMTAKMIGCFSLIFSWNVEDSRIENYSRDHGEMPVIHITLLITAHFSTSLSEVSLCRRVTQY